jgi:hypothetical protein
MTFLSTDLGYRGGGLPLVAALETQELSMARSRERGSCCDPDARLVSITSDES